MRKYRWGIVWVFRRSKTKRWMGAWNKSPQISDMLLNKPARTGPDTPSPWSDEPPAKALLPEATWLTTSLCSCIGTKMTLLFAALAIAWRASSWRICMAAGLARISAAWRIRRAASTSARAAITFDSPIRFCWAAEEREAATSAEKIMSLMLRIIVSGGSNGKGKINSQDSFDSNTPFLSFGVSIYCGKTSWRDLRPLHLLQSQQFRRQWPHVQLLQIGQREHQRRDAGSSVHVPREQYEDRWYHCRTVK